MEIKEFMAVVNLAEGLKNTPRHSWTSLGRRESVAEHSWRLALMAYFIQDEFPDADIHKVILMGILHDIGEVFTGDIPAFLKTSQDSRKESSQVDQWIDTLPHPFREGLTSLFAEMEALETPEARIYKALDKMEAVIQHNEADISTWLPLEYDLQMNYGEEEVLFSSYMQKLKAEANRISREKILHKEKHDRG